MKPAEIVARLKEFLESNYSAELLEKTRKGEKFIQLDFSKLAKFDPDIAHLLLDKPEETIKAGQLALEEINEQTKRFKLRFFNLPPEQRVMISNLRSTHLEKFLIVEGIVRQKSDVRPQVTNARFECPSCGNIISVLQLESKFTEPYRCSCGRKGKFKLIAKELVDAQGMVLEENPEELEGGAQPKRINIFLRDDLVSPISERKTNPGSRVRVIGMLKEVPVVLRSGSKSTRFDLLIEANNVKAIEESFYDIEISKEEKEEIMEMSRDPKIFKKIVGSLAPSVYGYEKIKEALLLQLMGGVRKEREDGMVTRGDIHILLVGDPGAGKSQLLKRASTVAPKSRYVSGKGVSGAGLTAAVVRDEFLQGWSLEAGALVLANNGFCAIDEMDKMSQEDRAAMHEALEQQSVSISKANIQATLIARTTVLAAANPKFGRFDPYGILANQIDMPPTLINRFDLIFPIKDMPNKAKDEEMAAHILNLHKDPTTKETEINTDLLKKYISYARQNIKPQLTEPALKEIKKYYVEMRNREGGEENRSIPISPRQLEALVRLSEASAKIKMNQKVSKRDARKAIELIHYCLNQIGVDPETGQIDIDRITTGVTASQRNRILVIKEVIGELEEKLGKVIPIDDLVAEASQKGIEEEQVEEIIEKLRRSGDIFEPKRGFISKI